MTRETRVETWFGEKQRLEWRRFVDVEKDYMEIVGVKVEEAEVEADERSS